MPWVVNAFNSPAAVLTAFRLGPAAGAFLVASHRSPEPGHTLILGALGLEPLLDLGMRLGEGSGAALGLQLIESAAAILDEMVTFGEAGVSEREDS